MPFITICIPTYNRANTIIRTIESIVSQIFQDYEVLIIDDGSTDQTHEIIKKFLKDERIKYIYKENGGKHTALNIGFKHATGEFFMILDSDDVIQPETLQIFYEMSKNVNDDDEICGFMGKTATFSGNVIGESFPHEGFRTSYIDFHFKSGFSIKGNKYRDCCECVKTSLLKKYTYPEDHHTRFVPESLVLDQIGLKYSLITTNTVLELKEYREDGITKNNKKHKEKNIVGYLYKYVSNIDDILPATDIPLIVKLVMWWQYWRAVKIDKKNLGPRCQRITYIGYLVRFSMPLLNILNKFR